MTEPDYSSRINQHYGPANLAEAILHGLRRAGKDPDRLDYNDLAPVDQFHARGKQATLELARLGKLVPGTAVLDVGGGIGGPARTLAAEFGCEVTVIDMTEAYCQAGTVLTERAGLGGQVRFRHANALDIPFADACFDAVWMQHCSMNIADKVQLFREAHRVLRPTGRLLIHEVMAGANQPIHFPVPWASDPGVSFLQPAEELLAIIREAGFEDVETRDNTHAALTWFRARAASMPSTPPPLGLHLLLGETFRPALQNMLRNLEEERIEVIEAVFGKT